MAEVQLTFSHLQGCYILIVPIDGRMIAVLEESFEENLDSNQVPYQGI